MGTRKKKTDKTEAAIPDEDHSAETAMREAKVPSLQTTDELAAYIKELVERDHDYGTCVYAMSMAATAAFNHVASVLGVTGFQASCADMDILRRTRGYEGPFMVVDLTNHLYPQYDLVGRVREAIDESAQWFADRARAELAKDRSEFLTSPNVIAHWQRLAEACPAKAEGRA